MVSDEKQRIQNYTAMQMTKSFLLKFSAYKVHISETDLPKVVPEMIFKNQTLTINKSKLLMEPRRKTGRHLHSHLGSISLLLDLSTALCSARLAPRALTEQARV